MKKGDAELLQGVRFADELSRGNALLLLEWLREQVEGASTPVKRPAVVVSGPSACGKTRLLGLLEEAAGLKREKGEVDLAVNVNEALLDHAARAQVKLLVIDNVGKMRKKEVEGAVKWVAMPYRMPAGAADVLSTRAQLVLVLSGDDVVLPPDLERRCIHVHLLARE
jgi:ATPase subunit of ABC transporter with duplicated ATPase domains